MYTIGQPVIVPTGIIGPTEFRGTYGGPYEAPGAFDNEHIIILPSKTTRDFRVAIQEHEFRTTE